MKTKLLFVSLFLTAMTNPIDAQENPVAADPEVVRMNAESARLTAQAAVLKAQTDLAAAQNAQSPTVIEANRQKTLAETRKAAAEADKAAAEAAKGELTASLPASTSKPVEGNITGDDKAGYFARLLAFDALRSLAGDMVNRLAEARVLQENDRVYLTNTPAQLEATGLRLLVQTRLNNFTLAFGQFEQAFAQTDARTLSFMSGNESPAALAALPALVGVAADVAAYFRQDRTIAGKEVTVSDTQLMNQAVAGAWRREAGRPAVPEVPARPATATTPAQPGRPAVAAVPAVTFLLPGGIVKVDPAQRGKLLTQKLMDLERKYGELCSVRDAADRLIAERKIIQTEKTARLAELKANAAKPPTQEQQTEITAANNELLILTSELELLVKNNGYLAAVLQSFRTFADSLLAVPTGDTQSPMAKIFLNDLLVNEEKTVYLLNVAVVSIGGEMELRKWLWSPGKVRHRAGAVCAYTLYSDTGAIMASGLVATDRQTLEGQGQAAGTFITR